MPTHVEKKVCGKYEALEEEPTAEEIALMQSWFPGWKTQRGKCDACASWERGGRRSITKILDTIRIEVEKICPLYFQSLDAAAAEDYDAYELEPQDNLEYIERMISFCKTHHIDHAAMRALSEEQLVELTSHEVALCEELEGWLPDLRNMSWHVSLKVTTEALWRNAWSWPSASTAYVLWDHMVPKVLNVPVFFQHYIYTATVVNSFCFELFLCCQQRWSKVFLGLLCVQ